MEKNTTNKNISDADKTIESLKKINDFPFYIAKYHGDYKLNEYKDGAIQSPNDVVPFFQSLFSELGKPTKLKSLNPPEIDLGCSAFYFRDNNDSSIVCKNNEWKRDPILLLKTTPDIGYASFSMVNLNFCDFFQLGSQDHNLLLAPYVPLDGMNEKGLAITTLAVHEGSEYSFAPGKLSVGDFNLVRIMLDNCANIDEAITYIDQYNLMPTGLLPIHMLIADRNESCIIEFFNGEEHLRRNSNLNYLTNFLKLKKSDYDNQRGMCNRYQIIENRFENNNKIKTMNDAKQLLKDVMIYSEGFQLPSTIYSVIYCPEELCIMIKIGDERKYYTISF